MELLAAARTHVGRRAQNQDSHCVDGELGLYAVADGLGGRKGGEVASRLAVEAIEEFFHLVHARRDLPHIERTVVGQVQQAFRIACRRVAQHSVGSLSEMATTLVGLYVGDDDAVIAHVGDSRAYRLRSNAFRQLTRDHSLLAELNLASGDPASAAMRASVGHVVTQTIGAGMTGVPDIRRIRMKPGDRYLLCSDGLSDMVPDHELAAFLAQDGTPSEIAENLVWSAFRSGGEDNITAVVVDVV